MSIVLPGADFIGTISGKGSYIRKSVQVASTSNVNLASDLDGSTLDGITINTGDRILLKDQSTGSQNGIYVVGAGAAATVRAQDYDTGEGVASTMIFVQQGTANADTGWYCTNDDGTDIIGTDAPVYVQFVGSGVDGDVDGPGSSTDNAVARFDGTTGKILQNSGVIISDTDNITGIGSMQLKDVSAPSNPGAGLGELYKKTGDDGIFWKPDAAGAEVDLTDTGVTITTETLSGAAGSSGNDPTISTLITFIVSTSAGADMTGTLGDGTIDGTLKFISARSLQAKYTLTITNGTDANGDSITSITFERTGQSAFLVWNDTAGSWFFANTGVTVNI